MTGTLQTLQVERAGGIVTIRLNRPERKNAVTPAMVEELLAVLGQIAASDDDRVLVLTGAGGAFCAPAPTCRRCRRTASAPCAASRASWSNCIGSPNPPSPA